MRMRITQCALMCALFFTADQGALRASEITLTWTGSAGSNDWTNTGNWSGGGGSVFPQNGAGGNNYQAVISGAAQQVGIGGGASIAVDSLYTGFNNAFGGSGNSISIGGNSSLSTGSLLGAGGVYLQTGSTLTLRDASTFTGQIGLDSAGGSATLKLGNGAVLNGQIDFAGSSPYNPGATNNSIVGLTGAESVTNAGLLLAGNGSIGNLFQLTNTGSIASTYDVMDPGGFRITAQNFDNTNGTVAATGGSTIRIDSSHFANYDGASLTGGTYDLQGILVLSGPGISTIGANTTVDLRQGSAISNGTTDLLTLLNLNEGTLNIFDPIKNLTLTSPNLTNTGVLNLDGGKLTTNTFFNSVAGMTSVGTGTSLATSSLTATTLLNNGAFHVGQYGTVTGTGLYNSGQLTIDGTLDARGGTPNSFLNLGAATETLTGGTYTLSSTGTLLYDGGTGAHGGAIVNIGQGTTLSLARGGQIQYGVTEYDALATLTSNSGTLLLTGGEHSFNPVTGTLLNNSGAVLEVNGGASARVYGDVSNQGQLNAFGGSFTANSGVNSGNLSVNDPTGASPSFATFFGDLDNVGNGSIFIGANSTVDVSGYFNQTGGLTQLDQGTLQALSVSLGGGTVTGRGVISGDVDNSGAVIIPSTGNIEITGDYTQDAGGSLEEGLDNAASLFVDGNVNLSGIFDGIGDTNDSYYAGEAFEILHFGGTLTGDFSSLLLPTLPSNLRFAEEIGAHDIQLEVETVNPTATPEPSFFWLGGAIISAILMMRRKKDGSAV